MMAQNSVRPNHLLTMPMLDPSQITILWSTQGGRAKACARRTSRILRDYHAYLQSMATPSSSPPNIRAVEASGSDNCGKDDAPLDSNNNNFNSHYYGTSFDDFGANEFLKLGATDDGTSTGIEREKKEDQPKRKEKRLIVMFVSTTGDAEHCDCIQDTWRML